MNFKTLLTVAAALLLTSSYAFGQVEGRQPFPYVIVNNTPYPDSEVYVAIFGEDFATPKPPGNHVWVDCKTGMMKMMSRSDNTIKGPVYVWLGTNGTGAGYDYGIPARNETEGNRGPFNDAMYANCFTKLSEIPNKTIMLPLIQGCRVYFSFKKPLNICFRGPNPTPGPDSGYTGPAVTDPTDPNQEIMFDMIELTYDKYGYFGNTSRVDSYNYPMGIESIGKDLQFDSKGKVIVDSNGKAILVDSNKKIGERKTHEQIIALWKEYTKAGSGKEEFASLLDARTGAIVAPGKSKAFADGISPGCYKIGPHVNYYKSYVDKVWQTYSTKDLVFDSGDAGIWTGRVQGETFTFTCDKAYGTAKGIIRRKPTNQEVLEGKGCFDEDVQKVPGQQLDRVLQSQMCAALNRHVIPVDGEILPKPIPTITKNGKTGVLDFSKSEYFYQAKPSNYYAAFWHQGEINKNDKAYGFCYDDVWNYASAAPSFMPEKVKIYLNGWSSVSELQAIITPANQTFEVPTPSATLDGSKSNVSAASLANLTCLWSIVSKPAGSNPSIASARLPITTINGLATGITKVKLTISDGLKTDTAITTITIKSNNPCDILPIVNAGANQVLELANGTTTTSSTLEGTATDPIGGTANRGIISYKWTNLSSYPATIASPNSLKTAVSGLTKGEYTFELTGTIVSNCLTQLVSKSQVIVSVKENIICILSAEGTNGSGFNWSVTQDENPVLTFIPTANKSLVPVVIHYKVNGGSEGGYNNFSGKNFSITAKKGDKVEFYYVYTVPAGGEGNNSTKWASFTVGTKPCTITELEVAKEVSSEISIYPNPASTSISISIPKGLSFNSMQIISSIGMVVQESVVNDELSNIDISTIPKGIYFLQLIGNKRIVEKFTKR